MELITREQDGLAAAVAATLLLAVAQEIRVEVLAAPNTEILILQI